MCQHQHKCGFLIMLTCHLVSINSITKENHSWNFQASQKGWKGLTSVKRNIKQIQLVPLYGKCNENDDNDDDDADDNHGDEGDDCGPGF